MLDPEIIAAILRDLTVPVWPHAGRALGLSRNPTYEAVKRNEIPNMKIGGRIVVPTAPLRRMLGIDPAAQSGEAIWSTCQRDEIPPGPIHSTSKHKALAAKGGREGR